MLLPRDSDATLPWWKVRSNYEAIVVTAMLVVICVVGRLTLEQPNFKPSLAAALFAGLVLPNWRWAIVVPVLSLLLTDGILGTYEWPLMLSVYLCLAAPVAWYPLVQQKWQAGRPNSLRAVVQNCLFLNVGGAIGAVLFFVVTSFVVWVSTPWYAANWAGLCQAYLNALPFLKWMVQGNFVFVNVLLGLWIPYRMLVLGWRLKNDVQPALPQ